MITYKAIHVIKNLKKTYRYCIGTTIFVMAVSLMLILNDGQVSQRMEPVKFIAIYALYNFYMYFIAFLYAPHLGGDYDGRKGGNGRSHFDILEAERER